MGGKTVKSRYTIKWEMQGDDGAWQTVIESKSTKTS